MAEVQAPPLDPDVAPSTPTPPVVHVSFLDSLKSRKLIIAVLSSVVAFGNAMWNWGLTTEELLAVLSPVLGWVLVEGAADVVTRAKQD